MNEPPILSPVELQRICEHLYRRTGMIFGEKKRYYIERRVADRMQAAGATTPSVYLALLRADAAETQALVNSFTVNETYFYREQHQLRCLSTDLLPELIRGRQAGDKIRIWSNPCSTGEEAYSIALWLLENWRFVDAYNVEIVGSDIDTRALAQAVEGAYGERALSRLPESVMADYFEPPRHRRRHIVPDLRESVTFTPTNLIDPAAMRRQGAFDVVFCRNVLIYFDDVARTAAVRHLHDALVPGGFLCLGHTETLSRMNERFAVRRFADAIVYQRPGAPAGG
ncbi:MAG: protein-glutamate O-methyltransferase CheR [Caulobacteraceae bacterium]